jgi:hypothetical protein
MRQRYPAGAPAGAAISPIAADSRYLAGNGVTTSRRSLSHSPLRDNVVVAHAMVSSSNLRERVFAF